MLNFDNLPALPAGLTDEKIYPVGFGTADDKEGENAGESLMRFVCNVPRYEFDEWAEKTAAVYGKAHKREENEGVYIEFDTPDGIIYAYYIRHSREMRVIIDKSGLSPSRLSDSEEGFEPVLIAQYGLYYGKMVRMVTSDCGMCYFIRLPDNRLIMVDGGEAEQCTEPAMKDILAVMRRLTQTENGGKIVIAAWLCTHAHDDHMDMFSKLIKEHKDKIEVQRIVFNFPAHSVIEHNECVSRLKSRIKEYVPGAKYLKIHTGQSFTVCGVKVEALLTHEDILPMRINRIYGGMNGTSTVFRISDGTGSFIALGDLQNEGALELATRFVSPRLSCGFLQAAHHCINDVKDAYAAIDASRVLIPQAQADCRGRNIESYQAITSYNDEKDVFFAADGTDIFLFDRPQAAPLHLPQAGRPYDGSEY